ncbi:MAG: thiamine ABC transporter substrate-binding protein [Burkholderiales bacterium]|nr:MAG: thiamine ABC transporter substrate-binding protein [Burkholderiales bacterium]
MQRRRFSVSLLGLGFAALAASPAARAQVPLRVMTHGSFDLPKELLARFEQEAGVSLQIVKGGDAGEMLNRLILTRARPVADVVYGIDNTLLPRALAAGVLDSHDGPAARRPALADLPGPLVPVDYGYVTLNIDKSWFEQKGLALPQSLQDLTLPAYRNLLVVQNPATSSPGQAFMLATIAGLGEEAAFDWWARMRANGVKVVKGWSEAYYTEFSRNGGTRPIVVSYATSPAAEVFYSEKKISEPPTANLFLKGGVYRQVEGVGLVRGGNPAAREAAGRFIEFMRSDEVQQALQTSMWMYPVEPGVARDPVMRHATEPAGFESLTPEQLARAARWQQRWTRVVLK